jgi:hypothetical protein
MPSIRPDVADDEPIPELELIPEVELIPDGEPGTNAEA